jgi:hypothetical protein
MNTSAEQDEWIRDRMNELTNVRMHVCSYVGMYAYTQVRL